MISSQAFSKLTAMGVPLYQVKEIADTTEQDSCFIAIDKNAMEDSTLFHDLLATLNLNSAELKFSEIAIDLGLFNWQFKEGSEITSTKTLLITPPLNELISSPELKQQLWQQILTHI
ncbi:hypothetical protein HII17_10375 [Thalassotalea sp. M1531]|uniref:DNA polymerase III subunit psi n=1 Tax=Thalassotalea algicola TaxID=2716224 RepID=A0A7Y0LD31_9GAMM|nr:DNA polymerase III subunit psi [Thalassotalea algicola]NMP31973.1 hypothetical protein [Thalassotalea algicola]